jgi:hypothetical protein
MQVDTQDRFYNENQKDKKKEQKLKQKLIKKNIKLMKIRPQVNEML